MNPTVSIATQQLMTSTQTPAPVSAARPEPSGLPEGVVLIPILMVAAGAAMLVRYMGPRRPYRMSPQEAGDLIATMEAAGLPLPITPAARHLWVEAGLSAHGTTAVRSALKYTRYEDSALEISYDFDQLVSMVRSQRNDNSRVAYYPTRRLGQAMLSDGHTLRVMCQYGRTGMDGEWAVDFDTRKGAGAPPVAIHKMEGGQLRNICRTERFREAIFGEALEVMKPLIELARTEPQAAEYNPLAGMKFSI